jgi:hypothetical protein
MKASFSYWEAFPFEHFRPTFGLALMAFMFVFVVGAAIIFTGKSSY